MTPTSFAETLEKKLMEKANYNKDLIEEKNRIQGELLAAPGMLRNELRSTAIRDPLARESILGDRLGNIRGGLGTVTDLLNMRGQRYSDIINRASSQYADQLAASRGGSNNGGFDMNALLQYLQGGVETGGGTEAAPELVIETSGGGGGRSEYQNLLDRSRAGGRQYGPVLGGAYAALADPIGSIKGVFSRDNYNFLRDNLPKILGR